MARKLTSSGCARSAPKKKSTTKKDISTKRPIKAKAAVSPSGRGKSSKTEPNAKKRTTAKASAPRKRTTTEPAASSRKTGRTRTTSGRAKLNQVEMSSGQVLARAEADINSAIESLNNQMNTALTTLTELASARQERGKAVVRTAPLDRATATFQRLVAEVVDDHLSEMLGPLIALRNDLAQPGGESGASEAGARGLESKGPDAEFRRHSVEVLDHVLTLAGIQSYEARTGEAFDPLVHMAVGETCQQNLADGVVAEALHLGFQSSRGKVFVPAKVRVNRR